MSVYLDDLLDGGGFKEGGCDTLFNTEEDAMGGGYLSGSCKCE